ncbi:hypothetical protein ACFLZB_01715 [Nanoarchaeota archaeon]
MEKRGQLALGYLIISVLLIGVALIFFVTYAKNIKEDTLLEKTYFSRDVALVTNAVYASPGNLFVNYSSLAIYADFSVLPNKASAELLNFEFGNQKVIVVEDDGKQKISYPYADDFFSGNLSGYFEKPSDLFFVSDGPNTMLVEKKTELGKWKYPQIETKDEIWRTRNFMIGPEGNDLANYFLNQGLPFKSYYSEPDIYLWIEEGESNEVTATISYQTAAKSRKLATLIINKVLENKPNAYTWINVTDSSQLKAKEAGVVLRIGSGLIKKLELEEIFEEYYEE